VGFAPKVGTHVVEEGWKAERLKRPEAVRRFFFQPSSLPAFQPSVQALNRLYVQSRMSDEV
jgi:hypothetical protein